MGSKTECPCASDDTVDYSAGGRGAEVDLVYLRRSGCTGAGRVVSDTMNIPTYQG